MRIGPQELIIVLIIVLVIFGPKNLPKLGKMFGKTMKNFKAWTTWMRTAMPSLPRPRPRKRLRRRTRSNLWLPT